MGRATSFAKGFREGFQPPRKKRKKRKSLTSEERRKLREYIGRL